MIKNYEIIEMKDVQIFVGGSFIDFNDEPLYSYDNRTYRLTSDSISWDKSKGVTINGAEGESYIINYPLGEVVFSSKKDRNLKASGRFYSSNMCALAESFNIDTAIDEITFKVIGMSGSKKLKTGKEITAQVDGFDILNKDLWDIMMSSDVESDKRKVNITFSILGELYTFPAFIGDISTGGSTEDYLKNNITFTLLEGTELVKPVKKYDLIYDLYGGKGDIQGGRYEKGSKVEITNEIPKKKGKTFTHWKNRRTKEEFKPGDIITINEKTVLEAQYITVSYTVEYSDGRKYQVPYNQTHSLLDALDKDGYVFTHYVINDSIYKPGDIIVVLDDVYIEAVYILDISEDEYMEALQIFDVSIDGDNLTVNGFLDSVEDSTENFNKIVNLEYNGRKIVKIGEDAFYSSNFTGEFPQLDNLEIIGVKAFDNSKFTGEFPQLDNLQEIGEYVFGDSKFTGKFPKLGNIQEIGGGAFTSSNFTGEFPKLNNLEKIGHFVFRDSTFTGEFPQLDNLQEIGFYAFENSKFDNIPNNFYPGWDGFNKWVKPEDLIRKYLLDNEEYIEEYTTMGLMNPSIAPMGPTGIIPFTPIKRTEEELNKKIEEILKEQKPLLIRYIEEIEEDKVYNTVMEEVYLVNKDDKDVDIKINDDYKDIIKNINEYYIIVNIVL